MSISKIILPRKQFSGKDTYILNYLLFEKLKKDKQSMILEADIIKEMNEYNLLFHTLKSLHSNRQCINLEVQAKTDLQDLLLCTELLIKLLVKS